MSVSFGAPRGLLLHRSDKYTTITKHLLENANNQHYCTFVIDVRSRGYQKQVTEAKKTKCMNIIKLSSKDFSGKELNLKHYCEEQYLSGFTTRRI